MNVCACHMCCYSGSAIQEIFVIPLDTIHQCTITIMIVVGGPGPVAEGKRIS